MLGGVPVGQIRFDGVGQSEAEISVFLIPGYTGRGYGISAIRKGCEAAFEDFRVDSIVAFVRCTNMGSLSAFAKAGFAEDKYGQQRVDHVRFQRKKV